MQHIEVPRLGVELELQLPAYTTATVMRDPIQAESATYIASHGNAGSFNPLSKGRDRTRNLMVPSRIH